MARVFLDANKFIDYVEKRSEVPAVLDIHDIFISPLSSHILLYIAKRKVPHHRLNQVIELFSIVPFDYFVHQKSLNGPTSDFEDNVQLHSAANADCDIFLTSDKKLLNMKFFGKTRILENLSNYNP